MNQIHFFIKIPCKYTNRTLKLLLPFISWNFYKKRLQKWDRKENLQQNIVCLEQEIYTSSENVIQALLVMFGTFRRSGLLIYLIFEVWVTFYGKKEGNLKFRSQAIHTSHGVCPHFPNVFSSRLTIKAKLNYSNKSLIFL